MGVLMSAGGAAAWMRGYVEVGLAFLAAGAIALGVGLVTLVFEARRRRAEAERRRIAAEAEAAVRAEAARVQRERDDREMHLVAGLAREQLLEAELWRDFDEWDVGALKLAPPGTVIPTLHWDVAAILARGRDELIAARIDGWAEIARQLHLAISLLNNAIAATFPGPRSERWIDVRGIFAAAEEAADAADTAASARELAVTALGTAGEQEALSEMRRVRGLLFDALEGFLDKVVALDPEGEVGRQVADSIRRHRDARDADRARRRELQMTAAAAAERFLRDVTPAPEDLERSTLGRHDASLREIAVANMFALATNDEEAALVRWRTRIAPAQRALLEPVRDRGLEMDDRTRSLWTRIHNDGALELENAIRSLEGNVHAKTGPGGDQFAEAIAANIAAARTELATAIRRLVTRVDELQALEV